MALFSKKKTKEEKPTKFKDFPHLLAMKPRESLVFHSDYYKIDNKFASILCFFHQEGSRDDFPAFWGVHKIPTNLDQEVEIVLLEQVERMTDAWIREHQKTAESVSVRNKESQDEDGSFTSQGKASRSQMDLREIAAELIDGSAYLNAHFRLLVKAPTLEKLDDAIEQIQQTYKERFPTVTISPYHGEQRAELTNLLRPNKLKEGKGFHFTSYEYAGHYNLVTHGLEDPRGEYVGNMIGDVNNSAVLFDVNGYKRNIVVVNENQHHALGRSNLTSVWGSKLSQSALMHNRKVVHIILDSTDLSKLGPEFKEISHKINLNKGDINMFEVFGKREDELSLFAMQMQKLILMAEQAYETTPKERSIVRGSLEEIATMFYVDKRMWHRNAKANRDKLRLVGIPHREVPILQEFIMYLNMKYKELVNTSARDDNQLHAYAVLRSTFQGLLNSNGDLFNTKTKDNIDTALNGRRVIYDFSQLRRRGEGVAMAQLINVIGFAVGSLGYGDTVIIHGCENIEDSVKPYLSMQFSMLREKGGRVCYLYNNNDKMLEDKAFCGYDKVDYIIFGNMTPSDVTKYEKEVGQKIPDDLISLVTKKSDHICYIRRGFDNVVFKQDLLLGVKHAKVG